MFPDADVEDPLQWHVTDWRGDPYARGVYSFHATGCAGNEYDELAAPVGGVLLFAGEHTCKEHPDTIGGAMLSGLREAARILRWYLHPRVLAEQPSMLLGSSADLGHVEESDSEMEDEDGEGIGRGRRDREGSPKL